MKNATTYKLSQLETKEAIRRMNALESLWVRQGHNIEDFNKTPYFRVIQAYDLAMTRKQGRFSAKEWINCLIYGN